MPSRSSAVEKNFSAAASTYDSAAVFQRIAAARFADFIKRHEERAMPPRSILELGAGSGLLTAHLDRLFPHAKRTVSDISEKMLDVCRGKFGRDPNMRFLHLDFNLPPPAGLYDSFDAAFSSMAMHWADDLDASLRHVARTLRGEKPRFYLCLPLAESTKTLKKLFESESLSFPGLELPELDSIIPHLEKNGFSLSAFETAEATETYENLTAFLRSFRKTGTGRISGRRTAPAALRRLLVKYDKKMENRYHFAFFTCEVGKEK